MNKVTTSIRLKDLMKERELRQVDILRLTEPYCRQYNVKMNKSDLSQYVSGKVEPNQEKLFVLSLALNVSEAWLMGFDVPKTRPSTSASLAVQSIVLSNAEVVHMQRYRSLTLVDRAKIDERIETLLDLEKAANLMPLAAHAKDGATLEGQMADMEMVMNDEKK